MLQFVESVRYKGTPENLDLHQYRVDRTLKNFYPGKKIKLAKVFEKYTSNDDLLYKVRITYSYEIHKIEFIPYTIKKIGKLTLTEFHGDYEYKYAGTQWLEGFHDLISDTSDILFVKDGYLTDTSFSNILLREKDGKWITPASCLLKGTKREKLLKTNRIIENKVSIDQLTSYDEVCLINAMLDPGDLVLRVDQIKKRGQ